MEIPHEAASAVLVIFALTYLGIALGHVPGSKLNRTGIGLLGPIAIIIFSRMPTTRVLPDEHADRGAEHEQSCEADGHAAEHRAGLVLHDPAIRSD